MSNYLSDFKRAIDGINPDEVDLLIDYVASIKVNGGRLFVLGVGGSAATASHAVNDFRKLCNIEAYSPSDNVSELTARINDDGWASSYVNWLKISKLTPDDAILVLSVGGGDINKGVSLNLVDAMIYADTTGAAVLSIVGRDGGYAKFISDVCVMVPVVNNALVTPITESMHSVILHWVVSDQRLKENPTKW